MQPSTSNAKLNSLLSEVDLLIGKATNQSLNINSSLAYNSKNNSVRAPNSAAITSFQSEITPNISGFTVPQNHNNNISLHNNAHMIGSQSVVVDSNELINRLLEKEKQLEKK
jgi:hypothetical protein